MNAALKSVAVSAFAAQTLEGETWQGMCKWACEAVKNGQTVAQMKKDIKVVEAQMKKDYDVTAMPSAWRSAKSVVLAATEEGIELMVGGAVRGKTDVELHIKAMRITKGSSGDTVAAYIEAAKALAKRWATLTQSEQDSVPAELKWITD